MGSIVHWASGPFKLIIYLTPIAMLFSGIPPVKEFTWELLGVTLIYLLVSLTTLKIVSNGYGSIINSELFAMVNFWTQIKLVFRALVPGLGSRTLPRHAQGGGRGRAEKTEVGLAVHSTADLPDHPERTRTVLGLGPARVRREHAAGELS